MPSPARIFILALAAILLPLTVFAWVPSQIWYQGYLTDPDGTPLDTVVSMRFRMTDSNLDVPWTEFHPAVTVSKGVFAVRMGSTSPLWDFFATGEQWRLGVTVGSDSIMAPTTLLATVPFAFRVSTVDGTGGGAIYGSVDVSGNVYADTLGLDYGIRFPDGTYQSTAGITGEAGQQYYDTLAWDATRSWVKSMGYLQGTGNTASPSGAFIGGGNDHTASGDFATVSGGSGNSATANQATVGGGLSNSSSGTVSTVSGGWGNISDNTSAAIGGGYFNHASGTNANIGGGAWNIASNWASSVGGGQYNRARGDWATVAGGGGSSESDSNSAMGYAASVGGGRSNLASGTYATVPGGIQNQASGEVSFAAGLGANANYTGSFVWNSGPAGSTLASTASYEFSAGAPGGVRFYSNTAHNAGVRLAANASSWVSVSDSTRKRNIHLTDTRDMLDRLSRLPIKDWEYKSETPGEAHTGPMAQDFWNAFHLGSDSLGIATIDADGVLFATVQELARRTQQIDDLKSQVAQLHAQVQSLMANKQQATCTK